METNENEIVQNLWDAAKAILRGKYIAIQAYLRKQEKSQVNNLTLHLQELDKQEQTKFQTSKRKEIIMIRTNINDIETKKQNQKQPVEQTNETGAGSLKRTTKLINF